MTRAVRRRGRIRSAAVIALVVALVVAIVIAAVALWRAGGEAAHAGAEAAGSSAVPATTPTSLPKQTAGPSAAVPSVPASDRPADTPSAVSSVEASDEVSAPPAMVDTIANGVVRDPASAAAALSRIQPTPSAWTPDYARELFGQRWADVDRNGCDTRNDVLGRDLRDAVFKAGTRDCKVLAGVLTEPYVGGDVAFVSGPDTSVLVQIDHIVALAWAWRNGAHAWTPSEREAFANDPRNLRAVGEAANRVKRDAGPARWLPDDADLRCRFVVEWVAVVHDYSLTIDADDRAAAGTALAGCRP